MNTVSSASAAAALNPQAGSVQKKTALTQEDFLKLFTKQLQFQNPLAPMDNYQMAAQMAQLSTVQALGDLTKSMKSMEAYQATASSLQAVGLIGKKVEAAGNTLSIGQDNTVSGGAYQLANPGHAYIQIFDANGNTVRVIDDGVKDASKRKFAWDGKNQQGAALPAGNYTFKVSAVDERNQPIQAATSKIATVTGVSFENGIIYLNLGSDRITMSDLIAIQA